MPALTIISLIQAILKLAPEVISIIEEIVGHGNPIAPEQLPHILKEAADRSAAATPISSPDASVAAADPANESDDATRSAA